VQKLITIILIALFLNSSCFQRKTEENKSQLDSASLVQTKIPELTYLKAEGFFPNTNFKVVHQITGCFQYKARTLAFKKLANGYYVASYSEFDGSDWTGEYLKKNLNSDFIVGFDKFVGECKEMNVKSREIKVENLSDSVLIFSHMDFSSAHSISITDGLHFKTYSINTNVGPNPFNTLMEILFLEKLMVN
jgi:hypothetical protein